MCVRVSVCVCVCARVRIAPSFSSLLSRLVCFVCLHACVQLFILACGVHLSFLFELICVAIGFLSFLTLSPAVFSDCLVTTNTTTAAPPSLGTRRLCRCVRECASLFWLHLSHCISSCCLQSFLLGPPISVFPLSCFLMDLFPSSILPTPSPPSLPPSLPRPQDKVKLRGFLTSMYVYTYTCTLDG